MSDATPATATEPPKSKSGRLSLLLAMAMFVLVVDTSLMNVSISAVVHDIGTTVSSVQSTIAAIATRASASRQGRFVSGSCAAGSKSMPSFVATRVAAP